MELAPIAVFAYNRPDHLKRTLTALAAANLAAESELHLFSDGPRAVGEDPGVAAVRALLSGITGFKEVHLHLQPKNIGLRSSIVSGISSILEGHDRIIVLEDDIEVSSHFLSFMNTALDRFANDEQVGCICADQRQIDASGLPESFFLKMPSCHGWGCWARSWQLFHRDPQLSETFNAKERQAFTLNGAFPPYWWQLEANHTGELDTWAIFWNAALFRNNLLTLYPREALARNFGNDGSGVHDTTASLVGQLSDFLPALPDKVELDINAERAFERACHEEIKSAQLPFFAKTKMHILRLSLSILKLFRHSKWWQKLLEKRYPGVKFGRGVWLEGLEGIHIEPGAIIGNNVLLKSRKPGSALRLLRGPCDIKGPLQIRSKARIGDSCRIYGAARIEESANVPPGAIVNRDFSQIPVPD